MEPHLWAPNRLCWQGLSFGVAQSLRFVHCGPERAQECVLVPPLLFTLWPVVSPRTQQRKTQVPHLLPKSGGRGPQTHLHCRGNQKSVRAIKPPVRAQSFEGNFPCGTPYRKYFAPLLCIFCKTHRTWEPTLEVRGNK